MKEEYAYTLLDFMTVDSCPTQTIRKYDLVCEKVAEYSTAVLDKSARTDDKVADILLNTLRTDRYTVEHFMMFMLDTRLNIIGFTDVSKGSLGSAYAEAREVYRQALMTAKCAAIIVAHNHPSGDPTPSQEDLDVTNKLAEAGKLLGIKLYDHIITGDGNWVSLHQQDLV